LAAQADLQSSPLQAALVCRLQPALVYRLQPAVVCCLQPALLCCLQPALLFRIEICDEMILVLVWLPKEVIPKLAVLLMRLQIADLQPA
jgi:hypothetical protein